MLTVFQLQLMNLKSFGCYFCSDLFHLLAISFVFHYFRSRSFVYNTERTHYFNSDVNLKSAAVTIIIIPFTCFSLSTGLHHSTGCSISVTGHITGGEQHLHYHCVCPTESVKKSS